MPTSMHSETIPDINATKDTDHSRWFAMCMGIAILGYLLPWHSPLGRDFLVNSFSFGFICLGLAGFFWQNTVKQMSKRRLGF